MMASQRAALLLVSLVLAACAGDDDTRLEASGTIEATDVTVSPLVTGPIVRLHVREGDRVRRGDVLARIDASDLELQREQLLAALDITRAQYELMRNGARSEDVAQAVAAERQAASALAQARDDLRRLEASFDAGGIAEKSVADARSRVEIARRSHESAQLAVTRLRGGARSEDLRAGRARERQAEAQLAVLEKKIDDCTVVAPAGGVVTTVAAEEGEFAAAGAPLLTISKTSDVELTIYVPEGDLGRVSVGQKAELAVDAFDDRRFTGHVTYISPIAEFTPKNVQTKDDRVKQVFAVRIAVPNPDGALKAGLSADARLVESPRATVARERRSEE